MSDTYVLTLTGCDAENLVELVLTDEAAAIIRDVAARATAASEYRCQPRMTLTRGLLIDGELVKDGAE